ncbi:MAG: chromosomal replication initiator protein DnaA [Gammaproteobacteria bacterium]|nr:MAG: chromosomal replication initiator protein DnaA [Gammaproteobacteria bacterium]
MEDIWKKCLSHLEGTIKEQDLNTWIRPLQVVVADEQIKLLAPNKFVRDWVKDNFLPKIETLLLDIDNDVNSVVLEIGSKPIAPRVEAPSTETVEADSGPEGFQPSDVELDAIASPAENSSNLNKIYTFENFVNGESNQIGYAAALQTAENPGNAYNPLFIYGGVGLGKTHLMHAVGNSIINKNPGAKVVTTNADKFFQDMVSAIKKNAIDDFQRHYSSVDALLIDDIQFFANKGKTQEVFFHAFNALIERHRQIILTCDKFPKEVDGVAERLKSRFGWGLTVQVEPPELETRAAILLSKAEQAGSELPSDVAYFIAKKIRSNVRELEGALKRLTAYASFTGKAISINLTKEALKDLLAVQEKQVTIDNIQKTTAEYFKIRVSDLHSKSRSRSITRPRQIAMALAKELTSHSLPEIGDSFGGRDHTTVLHACKKVDELTKSDNRFNEDFNNLLRTLSN